MEKSIERKDNLIIVKAKFDPRLPNEKRIRFYATEAEEYARSVFEKTHFLSTEQTSLTISNYQEPYEGEWFFLINEAEQKYVNLADTHFDKKKTKKKKEDGI